MPEESKEQEERTEGESTPEAVKEASGEKEVSEEVNAIAILSYLGILVLVPLLVAKDDEFAQYHAKQGLVLLIVGVAAMFVGAIPVLGWIIALFVTLACMVIAIIGIVNVLKGEKKELPIIGKYAHKLKI